MVFALTTAQTVLVSVGASALITLVLLGILFLVRGGSRKERPAVPEEAMSRVVDELTARMDSMGRELTEALARTQEETPAQPGARRARRARSTSTRC